MLRIDIHYFHSLVTESGNMLLSLSFFLVSSNIKGPVQYCNYINTSLDPIQHYTDHFQTCNNE